MYEHHLQLHIHDFLTDMPIAIWAEQIFMIYIYGCIVKWCSASVKHAWFTFRLIKWHLIDIVITLCRHLKLQPTRTDINQFRLKGHFLGISSNRECPRCIYQLRWATSKTNISPHFEYSILSNSMNSIDNSTNIAVHKIIINFLLNQKQSG